MSKQPQKISVIGAGIMGIMSAYYAQNAYPDAKVILIDRDGFPAPNASYMAGGMLAPYSELDHMPPSYLPAGFQAIRLWNDISAAHDHAFEFSQNGSLLITHHQDRHLLERFKSILPADDGWQDIGAQEISALESALPDTVFRQGLHIKDEAHLHPQKAMTAILNTIKNKEIREVSLKQERESADWVIDCRGMGAKSEMSDIRGVKGETLIVRNLDFKLSRPLRLMHPRYPLYIVPRDDHIFMIGATVIESDHSDKTSLRSGMELMSALYSLHKSFGDAEILDLRAGIRPAHHDNMPSIIRNDNVIHCNGLFRHGYLFSPIMAQCAVDIIRNTDNIFAPLFTKDLSDENHSERRATRA